MLRLNDTQTILLSTASRRDSGSLYPLPDGRSAGARISRAVEAMLAADLIGERETRDTAEISRTDGDTGYGLFITHAGKAAINVEDEPLEAVDSGSTDNPQPTAARSQGSKIAGVLALMRREKGATLGELIGATDWLPHSTRAALTGLRKKGHVIERGKREDATCYRIVAEL